MIENTFTYIPKAIAVLCWLGALYALGRWFFEGLWIPIQVLRGQTPLSNNPKLITRYALLIFVGTLLAAMGFTLWCSAPLSLFLCAVPIAIIAGLSVFFDLRLRRFYERRMFRDGLDDTSNVNDKDQNVRE